jgi:hypothetical protein
MEHLSWNISNFSWKSIFQFLQGMWIVHINSKFQWWRLLEDQFLMAVHSPTGCKPYPSQKKTLFNGY